MSFILEGFLYSIGKFENKWGFLQTVFRGTVSGELLNFTNLIHIERLI